jgi:RIO kinase 2
MRYLSADDFRVLTAVEMGSKNHDVVPTPLIVQIAGLRSPSTTNRCIAELAKIKLISRVRNAKYDGYRLSYHGYDYLALKALVKRGSVIGVGRQIGIGKESDIFIVAGANGSQDVLKVHRLGRISFRTVKNNRDYLRNRQSASWMYLSRLAAQKEFAFMKALYDEGFSVPVPIDQSRHQIIMSLVDGFPMRQLKSHDKPSRLYSTLMDFIVRLASCGLIHCDFNEFNIMVRETFDKPEDEVVIIDFPQCVSISHVDAKRYFDRDVDCIRSFFEKKLGYVTDDYPKWEDVERTGNLDILVEASGFSKKQVKDLEAAMALSRETFGEGEGNERDEEDADEEDVDEGDEEEEHEEEEEEEEEEDLQSRIEEEIARKGIENMKMDSLGNYILRD